MAKYDLYVYINHKDVSRTYAPAVRNKLNFRVTKKDPFDPLSKRFKMYTHTIEYPTKEEYRPADYALHVYDPNARLYNYILSYYSPEIQVMAVELYFKFNDGSNKVPLIIGLRQKDKDPVYYTYNFISQHTTGFFIYRPMHGSLITTNMFSEFDLMTELLEEYNIIVYRNNQKCITIDMDITSKENIPVTYPLIGFNKNNITLSKLAYNDSFYRNTHKINRSLTFEGLYVLYERNSLYILTEGYCRSKSLQSVDTYYAKADKTRPVFIVLNFSNISSKCFNYTDLMDYFNNLKSFIKTSMLDTWDVNNFDYHLRVENDKMDPNVSYMIEQKYTYSYKVALSKLEDDKLPDGFTKYSHTPKNDYLGKNSLVLYNGEKLKKKTGDKFETIEEIQNIPYTTVTVYFGTRDTNIPLIIKFTKSISEDVYYTYKKHNEHEYWEKWESTEGLTQDISKVINKVRGEEANLSVSIYILIDKQNEYKKVEIETTAGYKTNEFQPEKINVSEKRNCQILEKSQYKCYEHDLSFLDGLIGNPSDKNYIILKLLIPKDGDTTKNRKYSEIIFYNGFNKVIEYINYINSQNSLYVYFHHDDFRPHSVVYGNKAFSPSDLESYYYIWYLDQNVNSLDCDNTDKNNAFLDKLMEVSYFLYPVRLGEVTGRGVNSKEYLVQKYTSSDKTTEIKTTVTAEDLNCYRKYTYTSNNNYIMGEISHGNNKLFTNFNEFKDSVNKYNTFPISVSLYHYLYDCTHSYPLMVVLQFRNGTGVNKIGKEYFELYNKENFKWNKIEKPYKLNDQSELEKKLKEIRERLEIQYEQKQENLITQTASNCKEDGNGGAVAGTFSILGLIGVGTGLTYYYFPEFFKKLHRRVIRLIPVRPFFWR